MRKTLTTAGILAGIVLTSLVGCSVGQAQAESDLPRHYSIKWVNVNEAMRVQCIQVQMNDNPAIDCNWMGAERR